MANKPGGRPPRARRPGPRAYSERGIEVPPALRFMAPVGPPPASYGGPTPAFATQAAADAAGMAPGELSRALQVYPPEIFPIAGAQEFRKNETFASPGVGSVTPAALQTVLPDRYIGIMRIFGYGLLAMTAATVVAWEILINGGPVAGYRFAFFPGAVPRVTSNEDIFLRVPMGATIDIRFTNTDGAVYTAGANYSGWFWQPAGAEAWTGRVS